MLLKNAKKDKSVHNRYAFFSTIAVVIVTVISFANPTNAQTFVPKYLQGESNYERQMESANALIRSAVCSLQTVSRSLDYLDGDLSETETLYKSAQQDFQSALETLNELTSLYGEGSSLPDPDGTDDFAQITETQWKILLFQLQQADMSGDGINDLETLYRLYYELLKARSETLSELHVPYSEDYFEKVVFSDAVNRIAGSIASIQFAVFVISSGDR